MSDNFTALIGVPSKEKFVADIQELESLAVAMPQEVRCDKDRERIEGIASAAIDLLIRIDREYSPATREAGALLVRLIDERKEHMKAARKVLFQCAAARKS